MSQTKEISRDEAESLLVFLANGTLQDDERAAVEAFVAKDAGLEQELEALRAMRRNLQNETPAHSPGALGLARLMRDIETEAAPATTPAAANKSTAPPFWKIAAVVLLGLFAAQSVLVYLGSGQGEPELQLASAGVADAGQGPTLRVDFDAEATKGEINALLLDLQLTIVDGPSALGFYTLKALDAPAYERALEVLQARPDMLDVLE